MKIFFLILSVILFSCGQSSDYVDSRDLKKDDTTKNATSIDSSQQNNNSTSSVEETKTEADTKTITLTSPFAECVDACNIFFTDVSNNKQVSYQWKEGLAAIDEIIKTCPESGECLALKGQIYMATLKYELADVVVDDEGKTEKQKTWIITELKKIGSKQNNEASNNSDNRMSLTKSYLENHYQFTVQSISKTDGISETKNGRDRYVISVSAIVVCGKTLNTFGNGGQYFMFKPGHKYQISGDMTMERSENGWRPITDNYPFDFKNSNEQ